MSGKAEGNGSRVQIGSLEDSSSIISGLSWREGPDADYYWGQEERPELLGWRAIPGAPRAEDRFRWARPSFRLMLPVVPREDNEISVTMRVADVAEQEILLAMDGRVVARHNYRPDGRYALVLTREELDGRDRVGLHVRVAHPFPEVTAGEEYRVLAAAVESVASRPVPRSRPAHTAEPAHVRWTVDRSGADYALRLTGVRLSAARAKPRSVSVHVRAPDGAVPHEQVVSGTGIAEATSDGWVCPLQAIVPLAELGVYTVQIGIDGIPRDFCHITTVGVSCAHWGWWSPWAPENRYYQLYYDNGAYPRLDELLARAEADRRTYQSLSFCGEFLEERAKLPDIEGLRPQDASARLERVQRIRQLTEADSLGFIGMPYVPTSVCESTGETLLRSLRMSSNVYSRQLGARPSVFASHDGTTTPQLPQILRLAGYDSALLWKNDWSMWGEIGRQDSHWPTQDGAEVRVLATQFHADPLLDQVEQALEQGKHACLASEEFSCFDETLVLTPELASLAELTGLVLVPIALRRYAEETAESASQRLIHDDTQLQYKGWVGGAPTSIRHRQLARQLEHELVALGNLASFCESLGMPSVERLLDRSWRSLLALSDTEYFWRPLPRSCLSDMERTLGDVRRGRQQTERWLGGRVNLTTGGAVIVNSLGFGRSGLVKLDPDALGLGNGEWLEGPDGRTPPQQRTEAGNLLLWAEDVPSLGWRSYRKAGGPRETGASVKRAQPGRVVLENRVVQATIEADGSVSVVPSGGHASAGIIGGHNVMVMKPEGERPSHPVSDAIASLSRNWYAPLKPRSLTVLEWGPARVVAAVDAAVRGSRAQVVLRFSLDAASPVLRVEQEWFFPQPERLGFADVPGVFEGYYVPAIFVSMPLPKAVDFWADRAYCIARRVLTATNHSCPFYKLKDLLPFRHGVFNGLSMVAPEGLDWGITTDGHSDFFLAEDADGTFLGLSLGTGVQAAGLDERTEAPYAGRVTFRYGLALLPADSGSRDLDGPGNNTPVDLWRLAQSDSIGLTGIARGGAAAARGSPGASPLVPEQGSLLTAVAQANRERQVVIAGVDRDGDVIRARVLELGGRGTRAALTSCLELLPEAHVSQRHDLGSLPLPPRSLREMRFYVQSGGRTAGDLDAP